MERRKRWGMLVGLAMVGAAVATELRKPPEERTWQGKIAGFVPYDFRPPTFERFRRAWWSPAGERLLVETPFGVGWTLNFGRLARLAAGLGARMRTAG